MDAIDNPSYFSLSSDVPKKIRNLSSFRKWPDHSKNHGTTSPSSVIGNRPATNLSHPHRNFRSLRRIPSEDTGWFLGKPRPEDIAPNLYSGRYHQRHSSTSNVNSNDLMYQDMVHCNGGDNDVFFTTGRNNQYYNTATIPINRVLTAGRRRHSIGSFLNRDRVFNSGTENESENRKSSMRRKLKKNVKGGDKMVEDELDILLVSCGESETATLWVNYLISCFQQISRERKKPPVRLQNIKLEDTLNSLNVSTSHSDRYPNARLQIIVICPLFVQKVQSTSIRENMLTNILKSDKVLAMILGVQDHMENGSLEDVFPEYNQWRKMNVKDQDPTFVGDFLGVSMDILSRTWHLQEMTNTASESAEFSIIPKKVKMGQNKLIILFLESLTSEDIVKVSVCKNGHRIEVTNTKQRNPYTIQFTMPACCLQISTLVNVHVEKNGKSMGRRMVKCESKMRELEQLLKSLDNPIQFLCQSFGLNTNDKDQLDTFLLQNFQKNTPVNFSMLSPVPPLVKGYSCNEEYPTLLHFSARYGLERLSWQLMESPGCDQACQIRNSSHFTPADMAEKANHLKLANVLKGYMQMTELSNVYSYLKGMPEKEERFTEYTSNYLLPKPLSDTYLIPPAARPVDSLTMHSPITDVARLTSLPSYANFKPCNCLVLNAVSPTSYIASSTFLPTDVDNYDVPSNGRPCTLRTPTPQSPVECKMEAYLDMNPGGNESSHLSSLNGYKPNTEPPEHLESFSKSNTCESVSVTSESHLSSKYGSVNQLYAKEKVSPDDELLEIINDFKNNVFTIAEVEALVASWQNRNDVQQSFRDKQEQLTKMRKEYDRIQRRIKDQMKRTTPFEKIRKFFSRGKPKQSESSERVNITSNMNSSQLRPASSLSLHSSFSGSSGGNSISSDSYVPVETCTNKACSVKSVFVEASSLDLSSLSLTSNCTIDENCEIEYANQEKCSLKLNITQEGDLETETVGLPQLILSSEQQNHVNICNVPEYVNVNISNGPSLNEGCKYTIVSSS